MAVTRKILGLALLSASLWAAPRLRLDTAAAGPYTAAVGASPAEQTIEVRNTGDGTLAPQLTSSASWLTASAGSQRGCAVGGGTCVPVTLRFNTNALARGIYTALVTLNDQNAVDGLQDITVTVAVGGVLPETINLTVPAAGTRDFDEFRATFAQRANATATASSGGNWLSVALEPGASLRTTYSYLVRGNRGNNGPGTYNGNVTFSNTGSAVDNRTVPVTLRVTTDPIARPDVAELRFRLPVGGTATRAVNVANLGQGTLNLTGGADLLGTGGAPRIRYTNNQTLTTITVTAEGATPGTYQSVVPLTGAANNATIPVIVDVVAAGGPPRLAINGAVNISTFEQGANLAQGEIVALFGEQLSASQPTGAPGLPLTNSLGSDNVRVLVNGNAAPLFFVSAGQVNFQLPYDTPTGDATVQLERAGTRGNLIGIRVVERAPRILTFNGRLGIAQNTDGTFAISSGLFPAVPQRAARGGEVITLYATGLGSTNPGVPAGGAAPGAEPLARVPGDWVVAFGNSTFGIRVVPEYVGLVPGLAGLYQVNVRVPANLTAAAELPITLAGPATSNAVIIAVAP